MHVVYLGWRVSCLGLFFAFQWLDLFKRKLLLAKLRQDISTSVILCINRKCPSAERNQKLGTNAVPNSEQNLHAALHPPPQTDEPYLAVAKPAPTALNPKATSPTGCSQRLSPGQLAVAHLQGIAMAGARRVYCLGVEGC